jgi:hypothetical protein
MRYFENYGREREAQTKYAALAADRRASHCAPTVSHRAQRPSE